MANPEHLKILRQGVGAWNRWIESNFRKCAYIRPDLGGAYLSEAYLSKADLSGANLSEADLSYTYSSKVNLSGAILSEADLSCTNLSEANLSEANLSGANLSGANLSRSQVLGASLGKSVFTGACLEDWNINSATKIEGAICEYVYLKAHQQERRPREGAFKPGEFAALFQQAVDTVDLIFKDGIDWQAFFQSFQELHSQYTDQELSIQAIEKKRGGAFVVRLEVGEGADKASIESNAKQLYEGRLKALEAKYEKQLRLQGERHSEEIQRLIESERQEKATLMGVLTTMANNQGPKYDLSNAQFAGGFAETVQGDQIGGTINNYGAKLDDINRLITSLRELAQSFPAEQKDDVLLELDDIEADIQKPQPDQKRIGRRLKRLAAIATTAAAITGSAATFSGDLNDFAGNVIELTETLGIPIEQVQSNPIPPANTP